MDANDETTTKQVETIPQEEIALRAYCLWEERGSPIGSPEEDWFRAEQEILYAPTSVAPDGQSAKPAEQCESTVTQAQAAAA